MAYGDGNIWQEKRAKGRKVWVGQWHDGNGNQVQRVLGTVGTPAREGMSRKEALAEKDRLRAETPKAQAKGKAHVTLCDACEAHFQRLLTQKKRKEGTVIEYRKMAKRRFYSFFGPDTHIARISTRKVELFVEDLYRRKVSDGTILNYVNLLHGIFKTARIKKWVPANVVEYIDNRPESRTQDDPDPLSEDELKALLAVRVDDDLGTIEPTLYLVAAMTGLRQGELLALRWQDVDFKNRKINVERSYSGGRMGKPKSKKSTRSVPTCARVWDALADLFGSTPWAAPEHLVFAHPTLRDGITPMSASWTLERYKRALKAAGIRDRRFHDLRHTYGTLMVSTGSSLAAIQVYMGHASIKTTQQYAKWAPSGSTDLDNAERAFAHI
jgi:integrase